MSIHHRLEEDELSDATMAEMLTQLGMGDTAKLYGQSFTVDTMHDCPTGAGNSIDRKTKYVDRLLFQEATSGRFASTGLTPEQIIGLWLDHEHCEICIIQGDNQADTYQQGHPRALRKEHEGVLTILRPTTPAAAKKVIARYEEAIWPALMRCYHRPIGNPPKDYWCGPLLDRPTTRDKEILAELDRLGVTDARKRSKYDAHYGLGPPECKECGGWNPALSSQENGALAACHRINGLVRNNRWCDLWHPRVKSSAG